MLYAICTNQRCDYVLPLQDFEEGRAIETPKECPLCGSVDVLEEQPPLDDLGHAKLMAQASPICGT